MSCDDYTLTLVTPAGYAPTHQLKVSVSWPVATADFNASRSRNTKGLLIIMAKGI